MPSFEAQNIAKIDVNAAKLSFIIKKTKVKLTNDEAKSIVKEILQNTLRLTLLDGHRWIDKYVPERTGQLRDNLHKHLRSSSVYRTVLALKIGTNIEYMPYVDAMDTKTVRHDGDEAYAYYYGHHGKIVLNDPEAIGHFWGLFKMYLRSRLRKHLLESIRDISIRTGVERKILTDQIKVII